MFREELLGMRSIVFWIFYTLLQSLSVTERPSFQEGGWIIFRHAETHGSLAGCYIIQRRFEFEMPDLETRDRVACALTRFQRDRLADASPDVSKIKCKIADTRVRVSCNYRKSQLARNPRIDEEKYLLKLFEKKIVSRRYLCQVKKKRKKNWEVEGFIEI